MEETVIVRELSPWQVISSKISLSEHDVVRKILGDDIIDEVETLHREVCSLLDIWREYRSLINAEEQQLENNTGEARTILPEPPMARSNLVSEISFFVNSINAKANIRGSAAQSACEKLRGANACVTDAIPTNNILAEVDDVVLRYVMRDAPKEHNTQNPLSGRMRPLSSPSKMQDGSGDVCIRPRTASTRDGAEAPVRPTSSKSADFGRHLDLTMDAVEHNLSVFDVDKRADPFDVDTVAERLRAALHHERDALLADAEFLRSCVDGEHDHRGQVLKTHEDRREPSLGDLRTVRSKLEKEYFSGIPTEEPSSRKIQLSGPKPRANGIQNVTRPRTPGGKALPPIALSSMRSPQSQLAGTPRSPTTSTTTPTSVLSPSTAPTTSLPPSKTPSLDGRPRRASRVRPPGTAHADATTAQHSPRTPRGEQKLLTSPPQPRPPPPASRHVRPRPPPGKRH
eukprot:m.331382 g.331382  ORF g.331382 m.331382 type:complete len:456 (+) comp20476_c0_seq1:381-1748(+)